MKDLTFLGVEFHKPVLLHLRKPRVLTPLRSSEFSETPNQAYFYANFWFCTRTFPAGNSNLRQFFFLLTCLKLLKNT